MNVIEIVKEHLEKNGYDGLVEVDGECGCKKDDLSPGGHGCLQTDCEPGYVTPCNCSEGHDFHVVRDKP